MNNLIRVTGSIKKIQRIFEKWYFHLARKTTGGEQFPLQRIRLSQARFQSTKNLLISDGKTSVTAIFDIGRQTRNSSCCWRPAEVFQAYTRMRSLVLMEDGFPAGKSTRECPLDDWDFSDALVCLSLNQNDSIFFGPTEQVLYIWCDGNPATPLYDYLKPFPESLLLRNSIPKWR